MPGTASLQPRARRKLLIRYPLCNVEPSLAPRVQRKLNIPAQASVLARYRAQKDMDEGGAQESRDPASPRGESALGDLAQLLVENPWMNQALHLAFGVRERASEAGASVIRNLNLPSAQDVDRLARRLRGLSERLEEVEDALDRLSREVSELRRELDSSRRPQASSQG